MTAASNSSNQKLSRGALIALVVGSMIGSGIFALPSSFGRATGGLGAMIARGIAGVGMLMLAFENALRLTVHNDSLRCQQAQLSVHSCH
jgi:arginine:ornithine antiporter/lysine permease